MHHRLLRGVLVHHGQIGALRMPEQSQVGGAGDGVNLEVVSAGNLLESDSWECILTRRE